MLISDIRIPDELQIALDRRELVLFAGAGVSASPPANLPMFNQLAREVLRREVRKGSEDRELGKLQQSGTDVHAAVASKLLSRGCEPTELHRGAIKLFGSADQVRIVTTNFDSLFTIAAKTAFRKGRVQQFCAPALPQGDDFSGIVYLHSAATENAKNMVLTDRDFGAAYITRGWARDFLIDLFSKYSVLFIGYSHNDLAMTYLARGLDRTKVKPRWAMIASDESEEQREHWVQLGVETIVYPVRPVDGVVSHNALAECIRCWGKQNRESLIERSSRLKALARQLPSENTVTPDYLNYQLQNSRIARDFASAIRHPAWIGWLSENGYLRHCFDAFKELLSGTDAVFAEWVCTFVRKKHPNLLLQLIEKNGQRMSPGFVKIFAVALWRDEKPERDQYFSKWISLLLARGEMFLRRDILAYLIRNCRIPEDRGAVLQLFDILTRPEVRVRDHHGLVCPTSDGDMESYGAKRKDMHLEVVFGSEAASELRDEWECFLKPNLEWIASDIALIASKP